MTQSSGFPEVLLQLSLMIPILRSHSCMDSENLSVSVFTVDTLGNSVRWQQSATVTKDYL